MASATFISTLNMGPLTFFAPGPPFCKSITASLHSSQKNPKNQTKFLMPITLKKSQSGNPESKRCALILSNLHLLKLHDSSLGWVIFYTLWGIMWEIKWGMWGI